MGAGAVLFARLTMATPAENRVYPLILPQEPTYPAISYQEISAVRTHAMGQDGQLVRVRMQVNAWARTYAEARAVATATTEQLSRYRGTIDGTRVHDVLLDNEMMTYESDTDTRRVMQDYTLFITNS